MNTPVKFSIKYDGPALANHEMDVRELAPALLALSDLIKAANHALYGEKSDVQINVHGTFKGGSFGIDLTAARTVYDAITSLLAGQGPTAAANLLGILGAVGIIQQAGGGLIALVKKLRSRTPSRIEYQDNQVVLTVIEHDVEEKIVVDLETGKLWQDRTVRQSLYQVIKPLSRDGIDIFATGRTSTPETVITKEESDWFMVDDGAIELTSHTIEQVCLIESVTFKDDNKWKLNNGTTFYAVMEDQDFLNKINSGTIRFGKGDRLRVLMKIVQHEKANKIETSYHVTQVLNHHIGHQGALFT